MREIKLREPIWENGKVTGWHHWGYKDGRYQHPLNNNESYQFTGKIDRKQKEMFEGDIIVNRDGTWIIEYINDFAAFYMVCGTEMQRLDMCNRSNEVIGNILQNPELKPKTKEN